jgi:chitin disaccharide deacetylase
VSDRVLIVNADDFGRSPGVNRGVARAHEEGIVTSATLMVRWPAAEEAAAYARRGTLGIGLHFDLGEWAYADGEWRALYEVLPQETTEAVATELRDQLERFERLVGRPPDHFDSHQHVHRDEPARTAVREAANGLGVPVRELTPGIRYSGGFFGQDGKGYPLPDAITVESLVRTIEEVPAGVTEIGCHPATEVDFESTYAEERVTETATLCDPRVRRAIRDRGIELRAFGELANGLRRWPAAHKGELDSQAGVDYDPTSDPPDGAPRS